MLSCYLPYSRQDNPVFRRHLHLISACPVPTGYNRKNSGTKIDHPRGNFAQGRGRTVPGTPEYNISCHFLTEGHSNQNPCRQNPTYTPIFTHHIRSSLLCTPVNQHQETLGLFEQHSYSYHVQCHSCIRAVVLPRLSYYTIQSNLIMDFCTLYIITTSTTFPANMCTQLRKVCVLTLNFLCILRRCDDFKTYYVYVC